MRALLTTALVALTLVTPVAAQQQPPGLQQTLQGLLSGNANQDQAVREADERGYQRGRMKSGYAEIEAALRSVRAPTILPRL